MSNWTYWLEINPIGDKMTMTDVFDSISTVHAGIFGLKPI